MKEMLEYKFNINGFDVCATYTRKSIEEIFQPLLRMLTKLQRDKDRRILVYLAAPPAVGKSTLAQTLEMLSKQDDSLCEIQAIGLDGFHYPQAYIASHSIIKNGKEISMKDVKGCPETFDIDKITTAIQAMRTRNIKWPIYDRNLHDVVENQIEISANIILIEGNWLLLQDDKWKDLTTYCDFRIFVKANKDMLKKRLIDRKIKGGLSYTEALAFYEKSDGQNVERVLTNSQKADMVLNLSNDHDFEEER